MAAKDNSIILNNVSRGISNEEYWFSSSVYNTEWVNIRESNQYYSLDWYNTSMNQISDNANSWISAMYIPNSIYWHYVSYDGWVYWYLYNYNNGWGAIFDSSYIYVNTTVIKAGSTRYGLAIWTASIHRWVYSWNDFHLWLLGANVVNNGTFDTDTVWNKWTGWYIAYNKATRNAGTLSDLWQQVTVNSWVKYRIWVQATVTAGTLTVKMAWTSIGTISASWYTSYYRTTATTSEALAFTPSSDFAGYIYYVDCKLINMQENYAYGWDTMVTSNYHPYIYASSFIYVAWGNTVTQFDLTTTPWLATNLLVLWEDETIVAMTNIGTRYYIYTNDTDWNVSRQYLWDWISRQPDEMIEWPKKKFLWVKNNGTFDYVVTGKANYRELYKVSWWDRSKVYESGYISNYATDKMGFIPSTIYSQPMDIVRDIVYIAGSGWLHSYWSEYPVWASPLTWASLYSESLAKNVLLPWWDVYAVQSDLSGNNIYASLMIDNKPYVYYANIQNLKNKSWANLYWSTWFVEYNPLLRDKLSSIKKLEKLQIGYQLAGTTSSIQIYIKIDDWSYILIKTITGTGSTAYYGRSNVMTNDFITANAWMKFYKVQFKVVLNTTDSTKSPKVFDFWIKTDDILDTF